MYGQIANFPKKMNTHMIKQERGTDGFLPLPKVSAQADVAKNSD